FDRTRRDLLVLVQQYCRCTRHASACAIGPCASAWALSTTTNYRTSICRNVIGCNASSRGDYAMAGTRACSRFECAGCVRAAQSGPPLSHFNPNASIRCRKSDRAPTGRRLCGRLGAVAATELVDTTTGIHDLVLAGIEGMGLAGNFHLDEWVVLAVFPLDRFLAGHRRSRENREIRGDILEYHVLVLGKDVGFHGVSSANH